MLIRRINKGLIMVARAYIRHPSDMPIELSTVPEDRAVCTFTKDISVGGLSFSSSRSFGKGALVSIKIPVIDPPFEAQARVIWCLTQEDGYEIGLEFCTSGDAYRARMVEQICHIEHYRLWVREVEGRELDSEGAAAEWIGKFAKEFPAFS